MIALLVAFSLAVSRIDLRAESSAPADAMALHEEAVRAYRAGEWDVARARWSEALEEDPEGRVLDRAAVLYDLGNVAWRQGQGLEAVAWYTAALRLSPRDGDARANLELVRGKLGLEPDDRGDLDSTVRRALSFLTLAEAEWVVLGTLALLAGALSFEAFYGGAAGRRAVVGALLVVGAALVPWARSLREADRDPVMVIAEDGSSVHSEPRAEAAVIGQLQPAAVVERIDRVPGWVRVDLGHGERGWAPADELFALVR